MESVNMHEAKTRLSQLVARAAKGEAFIIAKAGKPVARVMAYDSPEQSQQKRIGFMAGEFTVPEDFDRMGQDEIVEMFGG
ncbi:prevent-host-death family protein [Marinobacter sp. DSM 26671]|jgi:prevent-host-death family protein|uniref:Antitoxin n=1 Tax=Marinobacter manganoxydans MnI7-9 TaxID=1094979 RepID=G6YQU5_9GAMM|nr:MULTISPECIES: type II toxin-antitoxin system prevent-host-death family antitoxin [Marinobacter]MCP4063306.1 type II toxin-antitoxin system prevent-host-death family antitoxin [Gammaproteobacteria bacterium]HAS77860.1 type II toxin-antitoxin system prevent-host-death family antitoxin [Marinobacter adhaerens]EHJ05402.1 prevent-host-death protein [Marinobacter manganoxydans MnI7-9]MAK51997.1 type II toxin-antitoxin system prevent-host-death family antitoxin [Marinobacter sp.]MTI76220.1 type II|tara:strand:+ start:634 stop:873 length:240 start_codon:yes stop_codon:yes gene_type:complete